MISRATSGSDLMIDIVIAGLGTQAVPYPEALELQRATHAAVVSGASPDTLLLLEHPSVFTAGRRTEHGERPTDGTPVIDVDRGGKITWHGPGQLVGYPILRLTEPIDVVGYVRRLEHIIIAVLGQLGIESGQVEGRSGVWIRGTDKIAAIGIRVANGVTMHGFSLNCSNLFDAYSRIVACGLADAGATSITRELGREVSPEGIVPLISAQFTRRYEVVQ